MLTSVEVGPDLSCTQLSDSNLESAGPR